ncbi:hypothetical protein HDV00_003384 [Rhizophlyctis rosea]|nr:hypothetical protein HDV00_003384 [Rhizophlyctis rosea]
MRKMNSLALKLASFLILLSSICVLHAAPAPSDAYDFIFVGGGTAGLALASRLSHLLPSSSILVLEAGPDGRQDPQISIPGNRGRNIGSKYDWNLTTTEQPGLGGRKIGIARGHVLGGSSAINLMVWNRAEDVEYDEWEEFGEGWNWKSMHRNMIKADNFTVTNTSLYHGTRGVGTTGPISALINEFIPPQQWTVVPTIKSLGIPENKESLGGKTIGTMIQPSNLRKDDYTRSYSATGYLSRAGGNVKVLTGVRVQKINFREALGGKNGGKKKLIATSVTTTGNVTYTANKEVILTSGSLQSPGLLELSGIGSPSLLKSLNIPVLYANPNVGENLQDHIRVQIAVKLKPGYTSFDILRFNSTYAAEQMALYSSGKRSLYWYTGNGITFTNWDQVLTPDTTSTLLKLAKAHLMERTQTAIHKKRNALLWKYLTAVKRVPQMEIIFSDGYTGQKGYPPPTSPLFGSMYSTLIGVLQHPFSTGSIHISSSNVTDAPILNPAYLSSPYDQFAMLHITKYLRTLASTPPFSTIWETEYEPGFDILPRNASDAEYNAYVRNVTNTIMHPVGTCAMAPEEEGGVVDEELKVYGTANVRVVDASIMPVLLSAHMQTAVYGIAERAAEIIGDYYKR